MALYLGTQLIAGGDSAADISVDQVLKSGEHIATLSANGTATAIYAPNDFARPGHKHDYSDISSGTPDERIASLETSVSKLHELLTDLAKSLSGEVVPLHFNGDAFFDVPCYSDQSGLSVHSFKLSCRLDEDYERKQEIVWFSAHPDGYGSEVALKQTYGASSERLSLSAYQVVNSAEYGKTAEIGHMPYDLLLGISVVYGRGFSFYEGRISAEAYYPNEPSQKASVVLTDVETASHHESVARIFQGEQSAATANYGVRGTFYGLSCYSGNGTLLAEYLPFAKGQIAMILKKTPDGTLADIPLQGGAVDVLRPA